MKRFTVGLVIAVGLTATAFAPMTGYAKILTADPSDAVIHGGIGMASVLGYNGETAKLVNGTIEWSISNDPGVYRLWYYYPLSLNGAANASFRIDSEFVKKTIPLNFTDGNCGWREVSLAQCSTVGMTVELSKADLGETYATAVRFEKLGNDYVQLWNFIRNNEKHIIVSTDSECALVNGLRVRLSAKPKCKGDALYVPCRDLGKLLEKSVKVSDGKVSFKYDNGSEYIADGEHIRTFNETEMVNLSEIYKTQGKTEFVYGDNLHILTDKDAGFDARKDAKQLKTIATVMRTEKP